jgi:hypothetical protein
VRRRFSANFGGASLSSYFCVFLFWGQGGLGRWRVLGESVEGVPGGGLGFGFAFRI